MRIDGPQLIQNIGMNFERQFTSDVNKNTSLGSPFCVALAKELWKGTGRSQYKMVHAKKWTIRPFTTTVLAGEADRLLATQPGKHRWRVKTGVIRQCICTGTPLHPCFSPDVCRQKLWILPGFVVLWYRRCTRELEKGIRIWSRWEKRNVIFQGVDNLRRTQTAVAKEWSKCFHPSKILRPGRGVKLAAFWPSCLLRIKKRS